MLQDRIMKNAQYFKGIEMLGDYPILKVHFPSKWGVYPSKDGEIKVARSNESSDEWYYYTVNKNITLEDMFDLLEDTVHMNLSAIAKIELLKIKIEELKKIFSEEPLERLERMYFTIQDEPQKKAKRKYKKKEKTSVVEENTEPQENEETSELTEIKEENAAIECVN